MKECKTDNVTSLNGNYFTYFLLNYFKYGNGVINKDNIKETSQFKQTACHKLLASKICEYDSLAILFFNKLNSILQIFFQSHYFRSFENLIEI